MQGSLVGSTPTSQLYGGGTGTGTGGTGTGTPNPTPNPSIGDTTVQRMYQPGVPVGGVTIAAPTATDASQEVAQGTGTLTGSVAVPTAQAITAQATGPTTTAANVMQATQAAPAVDAAMTSYTGCSS
jgi:hypothetical protein